MCSCMLLFFRRYFFMYPDVSFFVVSLFVFTVRMLVYSRSDIGVL